MSKKWYAPWRSQKREQKSYVLGVSPEFGSFMMFGNDVAVTASAAISLYEQSTAVSIPINMIADSFSVLEPMLLIDNKMIKEHAVLDLLNKPSPYYTRELFLEMLSKEYLITGETMFVSLGNINRPPIEVQPISVRNANVLEGSGGYASQIFIGGNTLSGNYIPKIVNGVVKYIDGNLRELSQIRNYSTKSNSLLRGQSLLLSAAKEVRQHILGGSHNISILEKGGRISLVFHFDADMDDEDFEIAKKRVREQYGGAGSAGEIGVTAGGQLEIKSVGVNNQDMDFVILQKMAVKAVALQYHIPLPLVSDERQTLNNYREGKLSIYDDAVIPLSRRIFGGLSRTLLPRFGLDLNNTRLTFDPDQISALVSRRNDELTKRTAIGVETDNEIRAMMNREPYEGGDVVLKPAGLIPAGSDLFTADNDPTVVEDVDA